MKKILCGILICFFFISTVHAQNNGDRGGPGIARKVQKMKRALDLSDDQANKITLIFQEARQKQIALRNSGADSATFRKTRKEINKDARDKVKLVLSEEQRKKWARIMKHRRNKAGVEPIK